MDNTRQNVTNDAFDKLITPFINNVNSAYNDTEQKTSQKISEYQNTVTKNDNTISIVDTVNNMVNQLSSYSIGMDNLTATPYNILEDINCDNVFVTELLNDTVFKKTLGTVYNELFSIVTSVQAAVSGVQNISGQFDTMLSNIRDGTIDLNNDSDIASTHELINNGVSDITSRVNTLSTSINAFTANLSTISVEVSTLCGEINLENALSRKAEQLANDPSLTDIGNILKQYQEYINKETLTFNKQFDKFVK